MISECQDWVTVDNAMTRLAPSLLPSFLELQLCARFCAVSKRRSVLGVGWRRGKDTQISVFCQEELWGCREVT